MKANGLRTIYEREELTRGRKTSDRAFRSWIRRQLFSLKRKLAGEPHGPIDEGAEDALMARYQDRAGVDLFGEMWDLGGDVDVVHKLVAELERHNDQAAKYPGRFRPVPIPEDWKRPDAVVPRLRSIDQAWNDTLARVVPMIPSVGRTDVVDPQELEEA